MQRETSRSAAERTATGLGWFSIGLGLAQLFATRRMVQLVGFEDDARSRATMRALGVRELATGIAILSRPRPTAFLGMRVAGDAMDLALLGRAAQRPGAPRGRLLAALIAVAGLLVLDLATALGLRRGADGVRPRVKVPRQRHVLATITINRAPDEVYRFWRDSANLPRFMARVKKVAVEITDDRPNERIHWQSLGAGMADSSGMVRFLPAPGARGTEVHLQIQYTPPLGAVGAALGRLIGRGAEMRADADLRRLKQLLEVGEVVRSDASIHRGPHPARPPREPRRAPGALARQAPTAMIASTSAEVRR